MRVFSSSQLALALIAVACVSCAGEPATLTSDTAEAPPPPVETSLAPGSRLIDPRADELVRQMSALLAGASSFTLVAEELYDEVPEHSPRIQLANRRQVSLRRPDRLAGEASGDAVNTSFWYDGESFSVLAESLYTNATLPMPPTIDAAIDAVFERTGIVIPLMDFLYDDPYGRLMETVQRGVYLGIHQAAGVACHHLAFEQETIDWQLWIDAGDVPLPRTLVIAYKTEGGVPQYTVVIREWELGPALPDELFRFEPPAGAELLELPGAPAGQE